MWFRQEDGAKLAFSGVRSCERTPDGDIAACTIAAERLA